MVRHTLTVHLPQTLLSVGKCVCPGYGACVYYFRAYRHLLFDCATSDH